MTKDEKLLLLELLILHFIRCKKCKNRILFGVKSVERKVFMYYNVFEVITLLERKIMNDLIKWINHESYI